MSARGAFILIENDRCLVWEDKWNGSHLIELLIPGPDKALSDLRSSREVTKAMNGCLDVIDGDVLGGVLVDVDRKALVIAGRYEAIREGVWLLEQEFLAELGVIWSGWAISYEPRFVREPLVATARQRGHEISWGGRCPAPLDSSWTEVAHRTTSATAPALTRSHLPSKEALLTQISLDDLSIRAMQELRGANLTPLEDVVVAGDLVELDVPALTARGITAKVRAELTEVLAALDLESGMSMPAEWPAWRSVVVS